MSGPRIPRRPERPEPEGKTKIHPAEWFVLVLVVLAVAAGIKGVL